MTRALRALAAIGLTAGLVGVPIGPGRASSTICVGIVVDYGVAKPGGGANSSCVRVPPGANGADVLAARARALGRPAPTYRSDGLLCTIDGYPNDGSCASRVGGFYRYWGYYHQLAGSTSWAYSRTGPGGFTVADGSVEGWSFQNGESPPGRAPPPSSYGSICSSMTSPTPKASPTPRPSPSRPAVRSSPPRPRASTAGRSTSSAGAPPERTPPPGPRRAAALVTVSPPSSAASPSGGPEVTALSPVEPPPGSRSRAPIATLAGVALAGGIGAAAALRARSRRRASR